jgi:hypothetical protein
LVGSSYAPYRWIELDHYAISDTAQDTVETKAGVMRTAALWFPASLLTIVPLTLSTIALKNSGSVYGDFKAFYCASRVAAQGQDPYKTIPLRLCEATAVPHGLVHGYAVPAPLPGYAIGALSPLAHLPYQLAAGLWFALSVAALAICVYALTRLTARPALTVFAAFALSLGVPALPYGQLVPFAIAALALSAFYAEREKWPLAAAWAAATMVEPHIGLGACAALFIWTRASRSVLVACAVALALLSLAAIGLSGNIEYVTRVLPSHAVSELSADIQYSLAVLLHGLGASDGSAMSISTLSYAVMLVLGIAIAKLASSRLNSRALLVAIPPAMTTIGGPYLHITQIAAAIPAALLLFDRAPRFRPALAIVLLLLAVPWLWAGSPVLLTAAVFPVAWLAWDLSGHNARAVIASIAVATVFSVAPAFLPTAHAHAVVVDRGIDPSLTEAQWSRAVQLLGSTGSIASWLVRAPSWLGLVMLGYVSFAAAVRRSESEDRSLVLET